MTGWAGDRERRYIEETLAGARVAAGVMILAMADGGVLEVTVPECVAAAYIPWASSWGLTSDRLIHAAPNLGEAVVVFRPRPAGGQVGVRVVREPDGDGEPVPLAVVISNLAETYSRKSEALRTALERMAAGLSDAAG